MAVCIALLLLSALWEDVSAQDSSFCADQPESIQVRVGESVTIPCRFFMPMQYQSGEVRVYWRAGTGNRCGSSTFIYNHTQGMTHANYSGRITLVGDPERRTGSIRIDRLTEADTTVKYCCRIEIIERKEAVLSWQNRHMTRLLLAGGPRQSFVYQLDAIPALEGGSVTIPCRYSHPGEWSPVQVIWKAGYGDLCSDFADIYAAGNGRDNYKGRVTLVADPRGRGPSSLHIRDLQVSDSRRYCCRVQISTSEWIESSHGTDLILGGRKPIPGFSVKQSEITAQTGESITMNCTYAHPTDRDPMWIGVYWTVGDQWEKFVYDPNKESIHDDYRERTRLIGDPELSSTVSLQIDNVAEMDSQTYYCLVVFRFCDGNNLYSSKLQQGEGTRLAVQGDSESSTHSSAKTLPTTTEKSTGNTSSPLKPGPGSPFPYIVIALVLVLLVVVIMAVLILKKKGWICKGTKPVENAPPPRSGVPLETVAPPPKVSPEPVYSQVNDRSKVEDDSVHYAALDLNKPSRVEARAQPVLPNETIYSAVNTK